MKKLFSLVILIIISATIKAQTPAELLSEKIAKKMKDTLVLTTDQKNEIYQINMHISNQKTGLRTQFTGDSLRIRVQAIENSRDSLYRTILSEEKHWLYLQKKRNLVNNN